MNESVRQPAQRGQILYLRAVLRLRLEPDARLRPAVKIPANGPRSELRGPTMIRIYNDGGNVIQTHEHKGDFKE
jgi:hypothetical protein